MNRDEYLAVLETEPLTPNQRGAIMREFSRLGFHHRRDRAERLAACASLLGIDGLESTAGLTQGQAGQLVNALERITDPAELRQAAALAKDDKHLAEHHDQDDDEPSEIIPAASGRMTWPEALTALLVLVYQATAGAPETPSLTAGISGKPRPTNFAAQLARAGGIGPYPGHAKRL